MGKSAAEVIQEEIADAIPEPENLLQEKEKAAGLSEMAWLDFCYSVKRFSFNGNVINEAVFERISPGLGLDFNQVKNQSDCTPQWLNWRNKHLYKDGVWDLEPLLCLGFLLCAHPSRED